MQPFFQTPVHMHARRRMSPVPASAPDADLRWHLLDLVRATRQPLGLRDRDVAVLRGLLSLLPARATQRIVFASNRVLIERCDGIDERTLRRRISHLEARGLLCRRPSPNGKRYQLRGDGAALTYGIDLAPLFHIQSHLEALAEDCAREAQRVAMLKARIRDILFRSAARLPEALATEARLSLRRSLDCAQAEALLNRLTEAGECPCVDVEFPSGAVVLTASDSHFDRHIQSSNEESVEKTGHEAKAPVETDLTIGECMALAPNSRSLAVEAPRDWGDVVALSGQLGPAIGLSPRMLGEADRCLGPLGRALAVIGLVEAVDRVRNPQAYLAALLKTARGGGLDVCRMFRSLVRRPASVACLPG